MAEIPELADIEYPRVRDAWPSEDGHFTPWVASERGIALLGDCIRLSLSEPETEVEVGPFRADVVCTDTFTADEGATVVIENQLEPSDHAHLGQLLTYSAGLHASIFIWVATEFQEAHRVALQRLNEITGNDSHFFGLKIELLKIGDSPMAPHFVVDVEPSYWSAFANGPGPGPDPVSPLAETNQRFWAQFADYVNRTETEIKAGKPQPYHFMDFGIRNANANLSAVRLTRDRRIRVELTLKGEMHKGFYNALLTERDEIETEINGGALKWDTRSTRSSVELIADMDPSDESDWEAQTVWMLKKLELFDKAFRGRVQRIQLPS